MKRKKFIRGLVAWAAAMALCVPAQAQEQPSQRVSQLLAGMTLEEKVEQMLMPDFRDWSTTEQGAAQDFTTMNEQVAKVLQEHDFGGVILFADNVKTTQQSFELVQAIQTENRRGKEAPVPLLIGIDQEGGIVYRLGSGCALPGNMALGAAGDIAYAKMAGEIMGSELSALGINTNFAPSVDVNSNPNNPVIGLRSFGDDPHKVAQLGVAMMEGMRAYNVITSAKHFPGHGDTATDSHSGLPVVDKPYQQLQELELLPFQAAMDAGVDMVMVAHIAYPQVDATQINGSYIPATVSQKFLTDIVRGEMGYEGVLITDAMNMAGLANLYTQSAGCIAAIQAGMDMLLMPCVLDRESSVTHLDRIIADILAAVERGDITQERIDQAVTRILTMKERRGVLDDRPENYTLERAMAAVGSQENRQKEREVAAAGVTVVKNEGDLLPLRTRPGEKVLLLGAYPNEAPGLELGFRRAQEAGLVEGVSYECVVYQDVSADTLKAKIAESDYVVIISQLSGAASLRPGSTWLRDTPQLLVDTARELGKKSVVISVSTPYDVQLYDGADAVMAVYGNKGMDPTEGLLPDAAFGPNIPAGVEVAFGVYPAQGTLPVDVMAYDPQQAAFTQEVFGGHGVTYGNGYGLTYDRVTAGDRGEITRLLDTISGLNAQDYTSVAWNTLQDLSAQAQALLEYSCVTAQEVQSITTQVERAVEDTIHTETIPPTQTAQSQEETQGSGHRVVWYVLALALAVACLCAIAAHRRSRTRV